MRHSNQTRKKILGIVGWGLVALMSAAYFVWAGTDFGKKISPEPAAPVAAISSASDAATDKKEILVWITANGKKYHSNPNCSNMKNPHRVTLEEAQDSGRDPCGKCY